MSNLKPFDCTGNPACHYFTPQEACWIHGVPAAALNQARACTVLGSEDHEGKRLIPASAVRAFARYLDNLEIVRRLRVFVDDGADELDGAHGKTSNETSTTANNEIV